MKIIVWTGAAWETWGPANILSGGIGGSETAAIHMAAQLALAGHEVEVIGQVTPCTTIEGVRFLDFRVVDNSKLECDVWISSRDMDAIHELRPKARLSVLWMHDAQIGDDWRGRIRQHDAIFCLSEWAKKFLVSYYPDVPREKVIVTRNGIDPGLFQRTPKKEGCKVVYSSSLDRGLDRLLDYWPKIREIYGSAQLDVYYGFDAWEKMARDNNHQPSLNKIAFFRHRLASLEDQGVKLHGRVGQAELASAYLDALMWLYPTNFSETSCITGMEAQAAGAFPIVSRLGALPETVRYGLFVDPPNTADCYEAEFMKHVRSVDSWLSTGRQHDLWRPGREWALQSLSWAQVASTWEELFSEKIASKEKTR